MKFSPQHTPEIGEMYRRDMRDFFNPCFAEIVMISRGCRFRTSTMELRFRVSPVMTASIPLHIRWAKCIIARGGGIGKKKMAECAGCAPRHHRRGAPMYAPARRRNGQARSLQRARSAPSPDGKKRAGTRCLGSGGLSCNAKLDNSTPAAEGRSPKGAQPLPVSSTATFCAVTQSSAALKA